MKIERDTIIENLRSLRSPIEGDRESARNWIRETPRDELLTELAALLEHPDIDICCDAARCALTMDRQLGTPLVRRLLKHPSSTVRWFVCGLFHDFGSNEITETLIEVLANDPASKVRLNAALALGTIGDPSALPFLHYAAETDTGTDWEGRTVSDAARHAIDCITSPPKPRWS